MRGIVIGKGIRTIEFRDLFRMYCECDSYPIVMAGCGFVYRHMERVIGMILRSPAVFIDVGANVGFVTLLACSADRRSNGVVAHCFEPDPAAFGWLEKNLALNPFHTTANAFALGSLEGEGELTVSARSGWSTLAKEPPGGFSFLPKAGKTTVKVSTLDAYCGERGLLPDLVKIDVEGYERQVIDGARSILSETRPYLIVEVNPLRLAAAGTSGEELIDELLRLQYSLFHVDPRCVGSVRSVDRASWRGLPEVNAQDLKRGRDFDLVAVP